LPFASAVTYLIIIQWVFSNPRILNNPLLTPPLSIYINGTSIALVIITLLTSLLITKRGQLASWYNFSLFPLAIIFSVVPYLVISDSQSLLQLVVAWGSAILIYLYWRYVFFYLYTPSRYTAFSLENISFYGNFFVIFLLGAGVLGLKLFLGLGGLMVTGLVAVILALVIYQSFWVSKYSFKESWPVYVGSWLVLLETFFALTLLPNDYQLLAFVWSTIYYLVVTIVSDYLGHQLNSFKMKAYLIIAGVSWLLLFATAQWI